MLSHLKFRSQGATRERNRVQKLLDQTNVKIASVLTDVFGVSGLQMLLALLDGQAQLWRSHNWHAG
jgi:hypothetical protein